MLNVDANIPRSPYPAQLTGTPTRRVYVESNTSMGQACVFLSGMGHGFDQFRQNLETKALPL